MPQILILTMHNDAHAQAVDWVLSNRGVSTDCWVQSDFPNSQLISLHTSNAQQGEVKIRDRAGSIRPGNTDCVWARRFSRVSIDGISTQADRIVAEREATRFLDSVRTTVGRDAFWVNPLESRGLSESKAFQLNLAASLKLDIPETLMSNDMGEIQEFAKHHGLVAYKTFVPARWLTESSFHATYTTLLRADDIVNENSFKLCPGIYQQYIPKAFEVRLNIMGQTCIAAKLDSQAFDETNVDWRAFSTLRPEMTVEPISIPSEIVTKCIKLMKKLNIVFGCFDFIVTPDGQYVFLEVNPMGQFLWIEQACPDIPLLACFSDFLLSSSKKFIWKNREKISQQESFAHLLEDSQFKKHCDDFNEIHDEIENIAVVKDGAKR